MTDDIYVISDLVCSVYSETEDPATLRVHFGRLMCFHTADLPERRMYVISRDFDDFTYHMYEHHPHVARILFSYPGAGKWYHGHNMWGDVV